MTMTPSDGGTASGLTRRFFNWRNLRRTAIGLAVLGTLLAIFYTVENWRGRRAWEQCKRELEAKGEKLDWEAFIPSPVPDDQNFFKAPGMAAWFDPRAKEANQGVRLFAIAPSRVPWPLSLDDLRKLPERPVGRATNSMASGTPAPFPASREELRIAFRELETGYRLLTEASTRPHSRLEDDDGFPPNFVNTRAVAQSLSVRAALNLLDGRSDAAVEDLALMRRVGEAMDNTRRIGPIINVIILDLYVQTARDGLEADLWKEPQLSAIQEQIRGVNLLASFARSVRAGERPQAIWFLEHPPTELEGVFLMRTMNELQFNPPGFIAWRALFTRIKLELCPRGWIRQNQAALARSCQEALDTFDIARRRIYPAQADAVIDRSKAISAGPTPYTFLSTVVTPNLVPGLQTVARVQTQLDQLQVVCALERCQLGSGNYPERLDALVPAYLERAPNDLFADRPLQYRREENGGYEIWSIGWDEKDGSGTASLDATGKPVYYGSGDIVWIHRPRANGTRTAKP